MKDAFAAGVAAEGDDQAIREILEEVCRLTGMGFAALARVTEQRWIAAQVLDKVEFGLDPGDELEIKKTICDDVRQDGRIIVVDDIGSDPEWRTHPVPTLYGFESYVSLPIVLDDGSFYGTLCALDPEPRTVSAPQLIETLQRLAKRVAAILSSKLPPTVQPRPD